jgi:hypothetical protein
MVDKVVTMKIGDKEYHVTEEFKAAIEAQQEEMAKQRKANESPKDKGNGKDDPGYVPEYVKDPDEFKKRLTAEVKESIAKETAEKEAQSKREKELWGQFYKKFPHLKKYDFLVQSVAGRDWGELKQYADEGKQDEFFDELGKRAETEFAAIKGTPNNEPTKTFVEGGPGTIGEKEGGEKGEEEKPKTLGQILNKRAEEREQARHGKAA